MLLQRPRRVLRTVPRVPTCVTHHFSILKDPSVLGQSRALGVFCRVPRSWDSPGSLGLSQKPRIPTCVTHHFSIVKDPVSRDFPRLLGFFAESQCPGTVPKTQNPNMCDTSFFNSQRPSVPGLFQALRVFGRVPRSWDSPNFWVF